MQGCRKWDVGMEEYLRSDRYQKASTEIAFSSLDDLIVNKMMTGRLKDQADVEELKKIHRK